MIFFLIFIFMMLSVGFYMLIERKILGYLNNRKGPNKIIYLGLLQFLIDMIKLLLKKNLFLFFINKFLFNYLIFYLFLLTLLNWLLMPYYMILINLKNMILLILIIMMKKMLFFLKFIWSIYSMYSLLSIMRLLIQNISYEIIFLIIIFFNFLLMKKLNLMYMNNFSFMKLIFFNLFIFLIWLLSMLIELMRLPFDFFESESELISGFNIEFNSLNFMILFLMEYLDMIFWSIFSMIMFINLNLFFFFNYYFILMILIFFIFIRSIYMRLRIDKMIMMMWKIIFPLILNFFILFIFLI